MDWSKTKSIFIVAFLCLNAFLFYQLQEFNHANNINVNTTTPFQEVLHELNVVIEDDIETDPTTGFHIVAKEVKVTEAIVSLLTNQKAEVVNETTIVSQLDVPYQINPDEDMREQLKVFLADFVYQGETYALSQFDTDKKLATFMKKYEDKVMYSSERAPLILQFDENYQVIRYQQVVVEVDSSGREQEFLSGMKAIEILLNEQIVRANDTITHVEFAYHSSFQPVENIEVFAPMWRIRVNDDDYLVYAIEGSIQDIS
ncbi:two-component system regulatory protein YycI [Alkalihalobacillus sp. LMS39]|uniref:two-component system regulatory protein YycI n=1 Tax=Alkalihalobacillus sp. LMS39 TaxID=2924032 RepID=UPI001FB4F3DB|nr:two-component system regulatory protein YycI [Alkalihalobacillus sp. LMS39]UOE94114.1 two-component system regulatory protein YycI [Alkalihalobacillus sp. LMS39]